MVIIIYKLINSYYQSFISKNLYTLGLSNAIDLPYTRFKQGLRAAFKLLKQPVNFVLKCTVSEFSCNFSINFFVIRGLDLRLVTFKQLWFLPNAIKMYNILFFWQVECVKYKNLNFDKKKVI
ncbi:hypothetical protein BpHYR1_009586 [Brachionus plicatilis]|uniref:Uncharacterized protein n=1 Tax=Brachionus plicatilis TaxID=10195 RepID=A0A3M7QAR3_BRAPC|nr:hypothetical protein BpHYR1_009586 [Brachionus plicatilis]